MANRRQRANLHPSARHRTVVALLPVAVLPVALTPVALTPTTPHPTFAGMVVAPWRSRFFQAVAIGAAGAATYHALAAAGVIAGDGSTAARLTMFTVIDSVGARLILQRPRWLVWPVLALTVQQVTTHGARVVRWWGDGHRVDWLSIVLLCALVTTAWLLWEEWLEKGRLDQPRMTP